MINLNQILDEKITLLDRQLESAKFTHDHAATPTESHSDKTRQNAEQLMDSLNDEKRRVTSLKKTLLNLPSYKGQAVVNSVVTLRTPTGNREFLIVPEGLGGQTINDIFLLSEGTPLAKLLLGKKPGHTFVFNGGGHQIVFVNPNLD